jgi:sugar transferase EpsL
MKRIIDIILSLIGLIILAPIIIATSILSVIFQGLPVFFFHQRLGKNGKLFTLIKLRTMSNGPSLSAKHDITRLTNWGRILRKTSIDELPVLINVLKGEMSLVGPRPLPIKYLQRFNTFQIKRLNVSPGITGLAQINGRNYLSWEKRFEYDVYYVRNRTFLLDIKILFLTVLLVFRGIGISSKDQEIMPEFMGENKEIKKIE